MLQTVCQFVILLNLFIMLWLHMRSEDGDLWCSSCCNILSWGLNSGMGWNSLEGLGFLRTVVLGTGVADGQLFLGNTVTLLTCSSNPFSFLAFKCSLGTDGGKSTPVWPVLSPLKPVHIFMFGLSRHCSPEKRKKPDS